MKEKINKNSPFTALYSYLLDAYGFQGWWPLMGKKNDAMISRYHIGDYDFPRTDDERLEICIGAILTQNTSWINVVKGLENLFKNDLVSIERLRQADPELIRESIRCVGYFNQKTDYLKNLVEYLSVNSFRSLENENKESVRKKILSIKGVGPETADCILLYVLNHPSFVVDAYTRRFLLELELIESSWSYERVKDLFESNISPDLAVYQEYHALLVQHGKTYYSKKPYGVEDHILEKIRNM